MTAPGPDWDFGAQAHKVALTHVESCMEFMDAEEDDATDDFPDGDPASAPFDGCLDCIVRESLFAAMPIFETAMVGCTHG